MVPPPGGSCDSAYQGQWCGQAVAGRWEFPDKSSAAQPLVRDHPLISKEGWHDVGDILTHPACGGLNSLISYFYPAWLEVDVCVSVVAMGALARILTILGLHNAVQSADRLLRQ